MALTPPRISSSRRRPHSYSGINGSISAHWASVISLAYPVCLCDTWRHSCWVHLNCLRFSVYLTGVFTALFIKWLLRQTTPHSTLTFLGTLQERLLRASGTYRWGRCC